MGRVARSRWRALWCTALLLLLGGCEFSAVHIQLAAFRSGDINGIWLWRLETSGQYARLCRLQISDPYFQDGVELVSYDQWCFDGSPRGLPMQAAIVRSPSDPDTITVRLEYQRDARPAALFRATAYNSAGESELSIAVVQL